jgi:uncharacterized membrane protein
VNTNVNANGQMNWHTKLRVSAGFCVALGILRAIACFISISFTQQPHRIETVGTVTSVIAFRYVALFILAVSLWQIFADGYGARKWGEPKKATSVAVFAIILAVLDGTIIIGSSALWVRRLFFSVETEFPVFPFLPLFLIFAGSIAVFIYAITAYSYAVQCREEDKK